jgi:hypothetical protein
MPRLQMTVCCAANDLSCLRSEFQIVSCQLDLHASSFFPISDPLQLTRLVGSWHAAFERSIKESNQNVVLYDQ